MATLLIKNLLEDFYQSIQRIANRANVSPSEAVIQMLSQAVPQAQITVKQQAQLDETAAALARIRDRPLINPLNAGLLDSTQIIWEDRDR